MRMMVRVQLMMGRVQVMMGMMVTMRRMMGPVQHHLIFSFERTECFWTGSLWIHA